MVLAFFTSEPHNPLMKLLSGIFGLEGEELMRKSFYVIGLLAGSVMGATQSTSRSLMSKLTPDDKKTEFFGFYSLFGKSSAIMGPFVFGLVSYLTESQRTAILSVSIFFIVGLFILRYVNDTESPDSTTSS